MFLFLPQSKDEDDTETQGDNTTFCKNQLNKLGGDAADVTVIGQGQHEGKECCFHKTTRSVIMCAAGSERVLRPCAVAFFRTNEVSNMIFINILPVIDMCPDVAKAKIAY